MLKYNIIHQIASIKEVLKPSTSFILINLLLNSYLSSQVINIVPNSGFDAIKECPDGKCGSVEKYVIDWFDFGQTPDYLNTCCLSDITKCGCAPNIFFTNDFQIPSDGQGFIGLYTYRSEVISNENEYVYCKLKTKLVKKKLYYAYMHVSPSFIKKSPISNTFHDGIGMALTDKKVINNFNNRHKTLILETVLDSKDKIITDTSSWTLIDSCYKAKGNEEYLYLGNFRTFDNTKYINDFGGQILEGQTFFDNIGLYSTDVIPDTIYLCNKSIVLNAYIPNLSYEWSTGSKSSSIEITRSGIYWVVMKGKNCEFIDSVNVINPFEYQDIGTTIYRCNNENLLLSTGFPETFWSNGKYGSQVLLYTLNSISATITLPCHSFKINYKIIDSTCRCELYLPNIFSPNSDNINDKVEAVSNCNNLFNIRLEVLTRWGERVVVSHYEKIEDLNWDGFINNEPANEGVYVIHVTYSGYELNNSIKNYNLIKDILLIR